MTQPFQLAKGTVTSPILCQASYPTVPPQQGTALSLTSHEGQHGSLVHAADPGLAVQLLGTVQGATVLGFTCSCLDLQD